MFERSVDHAFDMGNTSQLSLYRLSLYGIRYIWKGLEHTMYWIGGVMWLPRLIFIIYDRFYD